MRILVTGDAGWLGGHISNHLEGEGHVVVGFDLLPGDRMVGDLVDLKPEHLEGIEAVVHCAAIGDVYVANRNPALAFKASAEGTAALVAACPEDLRVFVHISTWEVYGPHSPHIEVLETSQCRPEHPYAAAKRAGELALVSTIRTPWRILRLGSAYGHGMRESSLISRFIEKMRSGEPLTIHDDGKQFRQWVWTGDMCRAVSSALGDVPNGVYNVVGSEAVTVLGLAEMLGGEIVHQERRKSETPCYLVSGAKAKFWLRWEPEKGFKEGVAEIVRST